MSKVSVLLDAGPIVHQAAGLHRYAAQLALHLGRHQRERLNLHLFHNDHSGHQLPAALQAVPHATRPMGQYAWRLSALAHHYLRSRRYERLLPATDLYHATEHLLPCLSRRTVLTVHDLIFRHLPRAHTWKNRAFLNAAMPLFTRRADAIIAVSPQTKRDLVAVYRVNPDKITVIPEGVAERFQPVPSDNPESRRLRARYGAYLLMVGTLEPRKNHAATLRAMAQLRAQGHDVKLVVAGGAGWKFSSVRALVTQLNLTSQVDFAGYVPDALLPALYSNALALIQPSLYEGFGFPVLEAMACGAPVVVSNRSSLPELAAGNALVADPDDVPALAQAILRLVTQPALRQELQSKGLRHARQFTWRETSRRTADLYLSLM